MWREPTIIDPVSDGCPRAVPGFRRHPRSIIPSATPPYPCAILGACPSNGRRRDPWNILICTVIRETVPRRKGELP